MLEVLLYLWLYLSISLRVFYQGKNLWYPQFFAHLTNIITCKLCPIVQHKRFFFFFFYFELTYDVFSYEVMNLWHINNCKRFGLDLLSEIFNCYHQILQLWNCLRKRPKEFDVSCVKQHGYLWSVGSQEEQDVNQHAFDIFRISLRKRERINVFEARC